jgi:hypothetical protein
MQAKQACQHKSALQNCRTAAQPAPPTSAAATAPVLDLTSAPAACQTRQSAAWIGGPMLDASADMTSAAALMPPAAAAVMHPAQAALAAANAAWQAVYYASLAAQQQPGAAFIPQPPGLPSFPPSFPPMMPFLAAPNPALLAGWRYGSLHAVGPQHWTAVRLSTQHSNSSNVNRSSRTGGGNIPCRI